MPPITWTRSPAAVPANYAAYLLGDDVLAVIDSLKVNRPVLVGQSIGDEELSSGRRLFVRLPGRGTPDLKPLVQELLQTILPQFEKDLQEMQKDLQATPVPPLPAPVRGPTPAQAIIAAERKFTDIPGTRARHFRDSP